MAESVHDNLVYAHKVDYEECRIVLHTIYQPVEPPEFTDIVFEGVVAHHFELQAFRGGSIPINILFDVAETRPAFILEAYSDLLIRTKNYGWPVMGYDGLEDLVSRLTAGGAKCFEIHGSCGLCGFVFAGHMEFRRRESRALVTAA